MAAKIVLTGKRFGRLVVLSEAPKGKTRARKWHCRCDCGNETSVYQSNLLRGTTSCGCYAKERTSARVRQAARERWATAGPGNKWCRKCQQNKPHSEFYPSSSRYHPDGYAPLCRPCARGVLKHRYETITGPRNIEATRKAKEQQEVVEYLARTAQEKRCIFCKQVKSGAEFDFAPVCRDGTGLKVRCKECWTKIRTARRAGKKVCAGCFSTLPLAEYRRPATLLRPAKVTSYCRPCITEKANAIRLTDEAARISGLRRRLRSYGISLEQYEAMRTKQGNRCGICQKEFDDEDEFGARRPRVDHCHATRAVRGLLCLSCNAGLGSLGDDMESLQNGIEYLRRSGETAELLATIPGPSRNTRKRNAVA